MIKDKAISTEMLNAFVDQQFSSSERREILARLQQEKNLAEEVCELQRMKSLVREAYQDPPMIQSQEPQRGWSWPKGSGLIAASVLMFMLGATSQQFFFAPVGATSPGPNPATLSAASSASEISRVLVHLSSNNLQNSRNTLSQIDSMMQSYTEEQRLIEVQVVANGTGIELMMQDSPVSDLINGLMHRYDNIQFAACNNTLEDLRNETNRDQGLLPGVNVIDSGVVKVIQLQQQGWSYIRS